MQDYYIIKTINKIIKMNFNKKNITLLFIMLFMAVIFCIFKFKLNNTNIKTIKNILYQDEKNINPIVISARKQIGVVTKYDTRYYTGGYPPEDSGACIDVIARALLDNGYNLKNKIDKDFKDYPDRYEGESDPNINYRRVKNVKIFFDNHVEKLTKEINKETLENKEWQAGDIVTYDQILGGLWHIAIISNRKNINGIPLLIHNHGFGTTENDLLLNWPTKISGHYRIKIK